MKTREILEKAQEALNTKDKDIKSNLVKAISKEIGFFDKQSRYYLYEEFKTESSLNVRIPSGKWPFSIYKHIFTDKYLRQLTTSKTVLQMKLEEDLIKNENVKAKNKI